MISDVTDVLPAAQEDTVCVILGGAGLSIVQRHRDLFNVIASYPQQRHDKRQAVPEYRVRLGHGSRDHLQPAIRIGDRYTQKHLQYGIVDFGKTRPSPAIRTVIPLATY